MTLIFRNRRLLRSAALALILAAGPLPLPWAADAPKGIDLARLLNEAFVDATERVAPTVVVIDIVQREDESALQIPRSWLDLMPDDWKERMQRELEKRKQERRDRKDGNGSDDGEPQFNGQGSGVVISKEGDILTNNHVVDGAEKLRIRLRDGRSFDAEVKGSDADADLAVIRIKDPPKDLPVAVFGDSDRVRVGEFAIALGAPYGLDNSVSFGHISAKGRSDLMGGNFDQDFLQTDANINPGNSGGPLVDIEGRVIGINSMIRGLNSGIGFAIPSNLAREIADRLITDGKFVRSWLGIGIQALKEVKRVQEMVPDLHSGVIITGIVSDGPASQAKPELKALDVITAVDGKAVADPNQLRAVVTRKRPGTEVVLDVRRSDATLKVRITPAPAPSPEDRDHLRYRRIREPRQEAYGLQVEPLPAEEALKMGVEGGVVVKDVAAGSIAAAQDIRSGDVITELNHLAVEAPGQFRNLLREAGLAKGILLHVYRDGQEIFPVLKQPKE